MILACVIGCIVLTVIVVAPFWLVGECDRRMGL